MKKILKSSGYIILFILPAMIIYYSINPKKLSRPVRDFLGLTCLDFKQAVFSKKLTDKVPDYIEYSKSSGIKKCKDENEIMKQAELGKLVKIRDSKGYIIDELSHSYPYLTVKGNKLLDEISERFREKISQTRLKGTRFKITSMTRTTEKLQSLRGVNSNASINSPHMYGNTFDISYINFSSRKFFMTNCDDKYLMEAMAEVIWQLRKEKKCWATFEKQQNCFHVVAR